MEYREFASIVYLKNRCTHEMHAKGPTPIGSTRRRAVLSADAGWPSCYFCYMRYYNLFM